MRNFKLKIMALAYLVVIGSVLACPVFARRIRALPWANLEVKTLSEAILKRVPTDF